MDTHQVENNHGYRALLLVQFKFCGHNCIYKFKCFRGDTAMVVSVTAGIHAGAWLAYHAGVLNASTSLPPYRIVWPTYSMFGRLVVRTIFGFISVIATKILCKILSYVILCAILGINWRQLLKCQDYSGNQNKILIDLVYRYVACFMIGVNTVYFLPQVFSMIGIGRPAFFTELWETMSIFVVQFTLFYKIYFIFCSSIELL